MSGIGGFSIDIGEIQGQQVSFYPDPVETAACEADYDDPELVSSGESLIGLTANVDGIVIPAYSQVNLSKDIELPPLTDLEGIRVKLSRYDVPDESEVSFPPQAPTSDDVSRGQVQQSLLDGVDLPGLVTRTGSDDGYGDYTFERTDPILPGETANMTIVAEGYNDWSQMTSSDYVQPDGVRRDRYIDRVELQDLDHTNSETDTGYTDYTNLNNTMLDEENSGFENGSFLRRGTDHQITVDAVGEGPDFGRLDQIRGSDADHDVSLPDPLSGNISDEAYIDDVEFQNIDDGGTGDDGGYRDAWDQTSGDLTPGDTYDLTVEGSKRTGNFSTGDPWSDPANIDENSNYGIQDTTWPSSFTLGPGDANPGDDTGDTGDLTLVSAGERVDVEACVSTESSEGSKWTSVGSESWTTPGVTVTRAIIDWDGDGDVDQNTLVGVHLYSDDPNTRDTDCLDGEIPVPEDVDPGTGTVRFISAGAPVGGSDCDDCYSSAPPNSFGLDGPSPADEGDYYGQWQDRTVWVQQPSHVSAFFDWTQDGVFETEVPLTENQVDDSGSWSATEQVTVPEDAVSGSTAMRVIHRNQPTEPSLLVDPTLDQNTYDGETHDYTAEVEETRTDSAAYAYFDWNRDGEFDDTQYIDDAPYSTSGVDLTGDISVPDDVAGGATMMRVVHKQDGWASGAPNSTSAPPANDTSVDGEYHDYTVHVESEGSFLRAWVDWDNNGTWSQVADFGTTGDEGIGEGNFDNIGSFSREQEITVPSGVSEDVHLMRMTHKQAVPDSAGGGPPEPAEGTDFVGETQDITFNTDPDIDPDEFANVTLGTTSFKMTELGFSDANVSGDVLLDERYTDGTSENPPFGPDGQFVLSGEEMQLKDVEGISHLVAFDFFDIPNLKIEVEYVDDFDNQDDPVLGGTNSCPPVD